MWSPLKYVQNLVLLMKWVSSHFDEQKGRIIDTRVSHYVWNKATTLRWSTPGKILNITKKQTIRGDRIICSTYRVPQKNHGQVGVVAK